MAAAPWEPRGGDRTLDFGSAQLVRSELHRNASSERCPYVSRPVRRRRPLSLTWKPIKMAEVVQMFLFLYKSKYRRKGQCREVVRDQCGVIAVPWPILWAALVCWVVHVTAAASTSSSSLTTDTSCDTDSCVNGGCVNGTCMCHEGWQGTACQFCGGKVR